jgi:hypothetical protein
MIYRPKFPTEVFATTAANGNLPLVTGKPSEFAGKPTHTRTPGRIGKTTNGKTHLRWVGKSVLMSLIDFHTALFVADSMPAL